MQNPNVFFSKLYLEVALIASVMNNLLCLQTMKLVNQKKIELPRLLSRVVVCLCVRTHFPLFCVCVCFYKNKKNKKKIKKRMESIELIQGWKGP